MNACGIPVLGFVALTGANGPRSAGASTTTAADSNTSRRVTCMSEHLVNRIDRSVSASIATRYGHQTIEKPVRRVRGFEPDRGSKVDRSDPRARRGRGRDHIRWSVPQAKGTHRDQRAVVGPECGAESSSSTPSARTSSQSALPPGRTTPRSRPSKVPPASGTVRRVPPGTAPISCATPTSTRSSISRRVFMVTVLLRRPQRVGLRTMYRAFCRRSLRSGNYTRCAGADPLDDGIDRCGHGFW